MEPIVVNTVSKRNVSVLVTSRAAGSLVNASLRQAAKRNRKKRNRTFFTDGYCGLKIQQQGRNKKLIQTGL
jgi:hypothetical protein